jgi:hypothetical protein
MVDGLQTNGLTLDPIYRRTEQDTEKEPQNQPTSKPKIPNDSLIKYSLLTGKNRDSPADKTHSSSDSKKPDPKNSNQRLVPFGQVFTIRLPTSKEKLANNPQFQKNTTQRLFGALANQDFAQVSNDREPGQEFSSRELEIQKFLDPKQTISGISEHDNLARTLLGANPEKIEQSKNALSILFAGADQKQKSKLASELVESINAPGQTDGQKLFSVMSLADRFLSPEKKQENLARIADELIKNSPAGEPNKSLSEIVSLLDSSQYSSEVKSAVAQAMANKITGNDPEKIKQLQSLLPSLVDISKGQLQDSRQISNQLTKSILDSLANYSALTDKQKSILGSLSQEYNLNDTHSIRETIHKQAFETIHASFEKEKSSGILGGYLNPRAYGASMNQSKVEAYPFTYSGPLDDKSLAQINPASLSDNPPKFNGVPTQAQIHQSMREGFAKKLSDQVHESSKKGLEEQSQSVIQLAKLFKHLPNQPSKKTQADVFSLSTLQDLSKTFSNKSVASTQASLDDSSQKIIQESVVSSLVAGLEQIDLTNSGTITDYLTNPASVLPEKALESALMRADSADRDPQDLQALSSLISTIPNDQIRNFAPALNEFLNQASGSIGPEQKQKAFMNLLNTRVQGQSLEEQKRIFSTVLSATLTDSKTSQDSISLVSDLLANIDDSKKSGVLDSLASLPLSDPKKIQELKSNPSKIFDYIEPNQLNEIKNDLIDAGMKYLDSKFSENKLDPVLLQSLRNNLKSLDFDQLANIAKDPSPEKLNPLINDFVKQALGDKKTAVADKNPNDQKQEFSEFLSDLESLQTLSQSETSTAGSDSKHNELAAYFLAQSSIDNIDQVSQALLDIKDVKKLSEASSQQINNLFDSVFQGRNSEEKQAILASVLSMNMNSQENSQQVESVARALMSLKSDNELFASTLQDLSQLHENPEISREQKNTESLKILLGSLQHSRANQAFDPQSRSEHQEIIKDLISSELDRALDDLSQPILDSDKEIYKNITANLLVDLNPQKLDTLLNQVKSLTTSQDLSSFLQSGKEILNTLIEGHSLDEVDYRTMNPTVINPLSEQLLKDLLSTSHAQELGLSNVSQDAIKEAADNLVDFAQCYDCQNFTHQNMSQILNIGNSLLNGLSPEQQKVFLEKSVTNFLTKMGMSSNQEHYGKLASDFITGIPQAQRKDLIDFGVKMLSNPNASLEQIFSDPEALSQTLGMDNGTISSAQNALANSFIRVLAERSKANNTPIDMKATARLLQRGGAGSLLDSQGQLSSSSLHQLAGSLTSKILDNPKTQEEHQYRNQANQQRESQHQATVRQRARQQGLGKKAARNWYPGARGGLLTGNGLGSGIAYPKMNSGYYNSIPEAHQKMREGVSNEIYSRLNREIGSSKETKKDLSLLSNIFARSSQQESQETRISDLNNLKNLSSVVSSLNPEKDFIANLSKDLKDIRPNASIKTVSVPDQPQIRHLEYDAFKDFFTGDAVKNQRQDLFRQNDYYSFMKDGRKYLAFRNKYNERIQGVWEYEGTPGDKSSFRVVRSTSNGSLSNSFLNHIPRRSST